MVDLEDMPTSLPERPRLEPHDEQGLTPWPLIPRIIHRLAWPGYECELCVGQEWHQGCYCAYYDCSAPGEQPEGILVPPWRQGLRAWLASLFRPVYALMARRTGHYPKMSGR